MEHEIKITFSAQDCMDFIDKNSAAIEKGEYTIEIQKEWIAQFSERTLLFLAKYGTIENRKTIASYLKTPISILRFLAEIGSEENTEVRRIIAFNPNLPQDILQTLAYDNYYSVRVVAAKHPNLSEESILRKLSKDENADVRGSVALNPNVSKDILKSLAVETTSCQFVDKAGKFSPKESIRSLVAKHQNTPKNTLELLARDSDFVVRMNVAGNPNTPSAMLEALAKDSYPSVREMCAGNPNTPISTLTLLAEDSDSYSVRGSRDIHYRVREAVAKNPNTPVEVLKAMIGKPSSYYNSSVHYVYRSLAGDNLDKKGVKYNSDNCYIATVCYGSYDALEVQILRTYRDKYLSKTMWGKLFIKWYYTFSPYIASKLKGRPLINVLIREYVLNIIVKSIQRH